MHRRQLLGGSAAALAAFAAPAVAQNTRATTLRFVPQANLSVLDPIVTTATVAAPKPKEPRGPAAVNKGKTTKVGETSLKEEAQRVKGELKSIGTKAIDGDYNQAFSNVISTVLGG